MRLLWLCIILILAASLVYANSFPGAFHFDDFPLLLENPRIVSPAFSYSSFLDQYAGRPLTLWTFHWNHLVFGENPSSYHWFSVFLHAMVVVEIFLLIYQLLGEKLLAFGTAVLFAVHPLQTQAVNYIWSRSVLLMAVFGLGALLLAGRFPKIALISFQLAIWSRTEAVILFLPLMFLNGSRRRGPMALAVINAGAFVYSLFKYAPGEMGWNHPDFLGYWILQPVVLLKYLSLMIWPVGLNLDHDLGRPTLGFWLFASSVVLALLILGFRLHRKHPIPTSGILWIALTLAPSALVPNSDVLNESRAYLSLAGFTLIASWAFCRLLANRHAMVKWVVAVSLLLLLVPLTVARNGIWKDDLQLWQDTVWKSPAKPRAHYNLGVAFARQGKNRQSEVEFRRALDMDPEDDFSCAALAYCAEVRNEFGIALDLYRKALLLNPENAYAREGLKRVEGRVRG
ncbi:hypothetical protein MYX82_06555 [Acidobacteria bacterium AH-259-D05]|nr:hypothetical protein [Acidobacteria bacterium AH-259-D05]